MAEIIAFVVVSVAILIFAFGPPSLSYIRNRYREKKTPFLFYEVVKVEPCKLIITQGFGNVPVYCGQHLASLCEDFKKNNPEKRLVIKAKIDESEYKVIKIESFKMEGNHVHTSERI